MMGRRWCLEQLNWWRQRIIGYGSKAARWVGVTKTLALPRWCLVQAVRGTCPLRGRGGACAGKTPVKLSTLRLGDTLYGCLDRGPAGAIRLTIR
jgi:hypothetical protein